MLKFSDSRHKLFIFKNMYCSLILTSQKMQGAAIDDSHATLTCKSGCLEKRVQRDDDGIDFLSERASV